MPKESFENMTVEQVLELVSAGKYSAEEAISVEEQGKNRVTLINTLKDMLPDPDAEQAEPEQRKTGEQEQEPEVSEAEQEEPKSCVVTIYKNIKYNRRRYKIGEKIEIDVKDRDNFVKAGIIKG